MSIDDERAADILFACARHQMAPTESRQELASWSGDARAGLALQLAVLERWEAAGERLGGWKVGMTSLASRDALGIGFRPFGYLLESRILKSGAEVVIDGIRNCHLEQEICLVMGKRLAGPDVTVAQARSAVSAIAPAFEIIERAYTPPLPAATNIANGIGQWAVVVGPASPADTVFDASRVELFRDRESVASGVVGPDVVDDPFLSLARLSGELSRVGRCVEAGQFVITGALLGVFPVDAPSTWVADFDSLGQVQVEFR